jgi:hypothetical protein
MAKEKVAEAIDPSLEVANPTTSEVAKRDSEVGDSSREVKAIAEGRIGKKMQKSKISKTLHLKIFISLVFPDLLAFSSSYVKFCAICYLANFRVCNETGYFCLKFA